MRDLAPGAKRPERITRRPGWDDPEPVFTIRAKDSLAVHAVEAYQRLCLDLGLFAQAEEVAKAVAEMRQWRNRHSGEIKMPDHKHVPAAGGGGR